MEIKIRCPEKEIISMYFFPGFESLSCVSIVAPLAVEAPEGNFLPFPHCFVNRNVSGFHDFFKFIYLSPPFISTV